MSTLDEIKNICLSRRTQADKVKELCDKFSFKKKDAENTIKNVLFVARMQTKVQAVQTTTYTYGVEIECYNVDKYELIELLRTRGVDCCDEGYNHTTRTHYKMVSDSSIHGASPVEIVTPVLKDLASLKVVCDSLAYVGARVNRSCGLHVHIGAESFTPRQVFNIAMNYDMCWSAICSFMPQSRRHNAYCEKMKGYELSGILNHVNGTIMDMTYEVNDRYNAVNLKAYQRHRTIEFRQHSGTIEFEKISNWIKFITALVEFSRDGLVSDKKIRVEELNFLPEEVKNYYIERARHFDND